MLVDSHCHLGDPAFAGDRAGVVARAVEAGVGHVVVIGESPEAAERALALARGDKRLSATAGLHPHEASRWTREVEERLSLLLGDERVVAAGEMGLDYHYDHSPRDRQREAFAAQLGLAAQTGKVAVIHSRDAGADTAAVLRGQPGAVAVLHSWSGDVALLEDALALGHYVSFSGMITFRSWGADDAIRRIPLDRVLVETDAPYLAPVPWRGKRNEPAFVVQVARRISQILGVSFDEVARRTTDNAVRVFGAGVRPLERGAAP